jgi:fructokinase
MVTTRARVAVIGEALVDLIGDGPGLLARPGGSPLNVAVGLGRLGVETTLVTQLGSDPDGEAIRSYAGESAAEVRAQRTASGRTSTARASIGRDGAAEYLFDFEWSIDRAHLEVEGADLVHVGSLGCFVEPGARAVEELLSRLPEGTLVTFDPNVRPELMPDHAAALARAEALVRRSDVVKLSDEDAAWLYPGWSPTDVIDHLLQLGPGLVAMTFGGDGCVISSHAHRRRIPADPVAVVDTIGAGDAFMSGMLFAVLDRMTDSATAVGPDWDEGALVEVGRAAIASAAWTVGRSGSNPPTVGELHLSLARGSVTH